MFSRRTILKLVEALNFNTHDEVERFALEFELEAIVSGEWINQKKTSISRHLIAHGNEKSSSGAPLVVDVVEYLLREASSNSDFSALRNCLASDGYELTDRSVRQSLPQAIPLTESENKLLAILKARGLRVAIGHYEQALAAHGRGDWAATNAQLRSFVEEFFNQSHVLLNAGTGQSTQQRKQDLASSGFFISQYNEFFGNGTGFVEGFWKRLHPHGSHPGLSESADSTFRLHMVLLVLHHYAERLDEKLR